MRIAPLAFCVDPFSPDGRRIIRDVSSITHKNDEAFAGALSVVIAIATPGFSFFPKVIEELPDSNCRDRIKELQSASSSDSLTDIGLRYGTSGYVMESVPFALLAASRAGILGFRECISSVIACGGDTDTIASIAGQIAGSKIGFLGIPEKLKSLPLGEESVIEIATKFANFICK